MKYITVAETAKLVRASLKEAFPAVKFSVRSNSYSGGASIDVSYTDGPKTLGVERTARRFNGSYFDGMIDYKGSIHHELNGEPVSLGADFIFVHRSYSDALIQEALDAVYAKFQGNFETEGTPKPTLEDYKQGRLWNVQLGGGCPLDLFQIEVNQWLRDSGDIVPLKSKTADSLRVTGDDGYSNRHGSGMSYSEVA